MRVGKIEFAPKYGDYSMKYFNIIILIAILTAGCSLPEPLCGNGKLDDGEDCDYGNGTSQEIALDICTRNLGSAYQQRSLDEVVVKCDATCKATNLEDTPNNKGLCVPWCGNGKIDEDRGEECDGNVFKDDIPDCKKSEERTGKTYECTPTCKLVDKNPKFCQSICGNGILDAGEECDPGHENAYDRNYCKEGMFLNGTVKCSKDCKITNSSDICKAQCGDGIIVDTEACDEENGIPYRMKDGEKEIIECTEFIKNKPIWWESEEMPDDAAYTTGKPECIKMCTDVDAGTCRYAEKYTYGGVVSCESIIIEPESDKDGPKVFKAKI